LPRSSPTRRSLPNAVGQVDNSLNSYNPEAPVTTTDSATTPPIVNYENKTVVVTGASSGVGGALIEKLRVAGAERIIAVDIKPCNGPVDEFVLADFSVPSSIDDAVWQLPERIDVLINNAGVAATREIPVMIGVNVLAPRRLISVLQHRMQPGSAVVITASAAGSGFMSRLALIRQLLAIADWGRALDWVHAHPNLMQNAYGFSKECAQALTLLYTAPLSKRGIRLNSVCPALIDTALIADFKASRGEPIPDWMTRQSGRPKAAPDEIADALALLGSDAASHINGTNLVVDNGCNGRLSRWMPPTGCARGR
jgi:NAD(P)-dependent dehydrogenase (short-subunit alcohol dehydrogenase family)